MKVAGVALADPRPVHGGDICQASRATASGRPVLAKSLADAPAGFFAAEVRGLDRLRIPGGPPVPAVVAAGDDGLVLEWIEPTAPRAGPAEGFGRALAVLHRAGGGERFGADAPGFIGRRPLDNTPTAGWPEFYRARRLAPYLAAAIDRQAIGSVDRRAVEAVMERLPELAGPAEPPARLHGDLWSGNLLWGDDGAVWLIDAAAAHDGHRETDLAMLALFGAPHLDRILAAYDEAVPLTDGWRRRVPLHQLHPLLIHAAHFGGHYGAAVGAAARAALG